MKILILVKIGFEFDLTKSFQFSKHSMIRTIYNFHPKNANIYVYGWYAEFFLKIVLGFFTEENGHNSKIQL